MPGNLSRAKHDKKNACSIHEQTCNIILLFYIRHITTAWDLRPIDAIGFLVSTLENVVLIPKCNLLHNSASQRGFQPRDGLRAIWNRVEQMDGTIIDLAPRSWGGVPAKKNKNEKKKQHKKPPKKRTVLTSAVPDLLSCDMPSNLCFTSKSMISTM